MIDEHENFNVDLDCFLQKTAKTLDIPFESIIEDISTVNKLDL